MTVPDRGGAGSAGLPTCAGMGIQASPPRTLLWGTEAFVGRGYEPLSVWQHYATGVTGTALPTGHFLPEEAPGQVVAALHDFLP
jgi:haloacetate dehalogenase